MSLIYGEFDTRVPPTAADLLAMALHALAEQCDRAGRQRPVLVWGLDDDPAGRKVTPEYIRRAEQDDWECRCALVSSGFDQRNIAVMVDGVPVNDMENGQVYWSNWDGLGDITKSMQVQRGLGASKLAVTSVGGTMNIITKGIDQKLSEVLKR